jgi:23S rRNA (uracil1939-C5)-methyltransferase
MSNEFNLSIEKLVYGGDGMAHAEGNTIFVPYVLPGEEVRASVRSRKKKLVRASLLEVQKRAPGRIAALCPHFGVCGGCHYQHIEVSEQVRLKKEILRETLSRLGGVEWTGEIPEHTAQPYGYRNRAQWGFRSALPRAFGYFLPESAHILAIDQCPVLSPRLAQTFQTLQEMTRDNSLPSGILEMEAFADSEDAHIALNIAFERYPKPPKTLLSEFKSAIPALQSLLIQDESKKRFDLDGPGYLIQRAGGFNYHVNHLSFFQVNRFLIEDLLQTVVAGAKGNYALDLYAGVGFFTLPLAKSFPKVVSVDANLSATRDLRNNAEAADCQVLSENVHAEEFLKKKQDQPDFVVLDPPRAGLGADSAVHLANLGASEIAYLSCDPATLARDLSVLVGTQRKRTIATSINHRYEISEVHLFDMFPQTFHIETLVRLRRVS